MPDIDAIRSISSGAIRAASEDYKNMVGSINADETEAYVPFSQIFSQAVDNINTTNAYLSDAENEEIKWALGESESTHDLAIALQKASTALQYTIAVRDKVVAAYREIMQMQI